MKHILFISISILSFICYGQTTYIDIPRTKISFPKLDNYQLNTVTSVLNSTDNTTDAIQFFEMDGGNFESNTRNFSKDAFEKKGMLVTELKDTVIAGFEAVYVIVQVPNQSIEAAMFAFGNDNFSVMINAIYDKSLKTEDKALIQHSILSLKYDSDKEINPFEGVKFKTKRNPEFIFKTYVANVYNYTSQTDSTEFLMITQLPYEPQQSLAQVAANAIYQAKSEGWEDFKIESETYDDDNKTKRAIVSGNCIVNGINKSFHFKFISDKKDVIVIVMAVIPESKPQLFKQAKLFASKVKLIKNK